MALVLHTVWAPFEVYRHIYIYTRTYIYIYIYQCLLVRLSWGFLSAHVRMVRV